MNAVLHASAGAFEIKHNIGRRKWHRRNFVLYIVLYLDKVFSTPTRKYSELMLRWMSLTIFKPKFSSVLDIFSAFSRGLSQPYFRFRMCTVLYIPYEVEITNVDPHHLATTFVAILCCTVATVKKKRKAEHKQAKRRTVVCARGKLTLVPQPFCPPTNTQTCGRRSPCMAISCFDHF